MCGHVICICICICIHIHIHTCLGAGAWTIVLHVSSACMHVSTCNMYMYMYMYTYTYTYMFGCRSMDDCSAREQCMHACMCGHVICYSDSMAVYTQKHIHKRHTYTLKARNLPPSHCPHSRPYVHTQANTKYKTHTQILEARNLPPVASPALFACASLLSPEVHIIQPAHRPCMLPEHFTSGSIPAEPPSSTSGGR
jgi:hypothetical protein